LNFSGFGGPVTVRARHAETGDVIQVYPDNGTNATTFADGSSYTWDYGFLPPAAGPSRRRGPTAAARPTSSSIRRR